MPPPSEAFLRVMREEAGWVDSGHLLRCNRCGGRRPGAYYVEWAVPVQLELCDVCARITMVELLEQRRPALLAVYRRALAAARAAPGSRDAPEVSERRSAEPV